MDDTTYYVVTITAYGEVIERSYYFEPEPANSLAANIRRRFPQFTVTVEEMPKSRYKEGVSF